MLFLLHWRYELPCQDKLPEFHCTPILGCISVLWLVFHPLGLRLDKALCGWNSVTIDQSISNSDRITEIMEQIAESINGLVDVARQSHETQQINMLYR